MYGEFYEANTTSGCSDPNASLSTWIGLGGDDTYGTGSKLIQTGVVATGGADNPFYEIIAGTTDTGEVRNLNTVKPKDEILVTLNYYPNGYPGMTTYPTTRFFFEDLRDYTTYAYNEGSNGAFDGRTAEAIDERHERNGTITALRQMQSNGIATGTYWTNTDAALTTGGASPSTPIRGYAAHREINMTQTGLSNRRSLMTATPVPSQEDGTLDAWVACGKPGL